MRTIAFTFAVFSRFARLMGGRGRLLCWLGKEYNAHHPIIRRRRTAGVNSLAQVPFRGGNDNATNIGSHCVFRRSRPCIPI